jgi:hypothetical protein
MIIVNAPRASLKHSEDDEQQTNSNCRANECAD